MAQQTSSTGILSGNNHQVDQTLNNANQQGAHPEGKATATAQPARSGLPLSPQAQPSGMPSVSYRPPPPSSPPPFPVHPRLPGNAPDASQQGVAATGNAGALMPSPRTPPPALTSLTALTSLAHPAAPASAAPSPGRIAQGHAVLTSLAQLTPSPGSSSASLVSTAPHTPGSGGNGGALNAQRKTRRSSSMVAVLPSLPADLSAHAADKGKAGMGMPRDLPALPSRPSAPRKSGKSVV